LVDKQVIVECKAAQRLTVIDQAQLVSYLKTTRLTVGLLINFNVILLKDGIKRLFNNFKE